MDKTYSPDIEGRLYKKWLDNKYFHASVNSDKKPFTIVMPPPNVTGRLHMGHALDNTMQDILIRFKRMQGYEALWIPGTDHASISTEVKVTDALRAEGIDKKEIGREAFLERTWKWKEEYGGTITHQLKQIGASCDWDRERFTMDEGCSAAVRKAFVNMYNKGLIYRGSKIVNWCPVCKTSISDAEVEHVDREGKFYHINYPIDGTDRLVEIATTRPETMLGDTAIAVNPKDDRYKDLVGKFVKLPLTDRLIPVIEDEYVDMEFGTGVVKITPAHDPNDFAVGERHNLPQINIMNDDATMNDKCGKYAGMDRYEARKEIIKDLESLGLMVKIESHNHSVGTHDRCGTTIEPMVKKQWFVKMEDLIKPAANAIKNGDIRLIPSNMDKTFYHWTDNIKDWCISRQLWWGHQIPAFYCEDCGEITVSEEKLCKCPKCGGKVTQDEDTLDTWFSSALWPFSTLGWPEKTKELEYFYPTDVLVTGYDIIFFWVIRMIFSGYEHMGERPFKDVLFHGLVRDAQGRKMSKSLGNGIDPLDVVEKYGADALRGSLISNTTPGNDMRFYDGKVEAARNFANKIWNASRFIMMNDEDGAADAHSEKPENLTDADKWIISRANKLVKDTTNNLEKFNLGIAYDNIVSFAWDEFCDWYVEMVKHRLYDKENETRAAAVWTLKKVMTDILKLLHPFMPFITEEIFCNIQNAEETIVISKWPSYTENNVYAKEEHDIEIIKEAVKAIRNIRAEKDVKPSKQVPVYIVSDNDDVVTAFNNGKDFFASLSKAGEVYLTNSKDNVPADSCSAVIEGAGIYIPLAELVDIKEELERLGKEADKLKGEIKRCEGMLSNEKFISKAPEAKVNEEKAKLAKYKEMLEKVEAEIRDLSK
ncbi:MAG: valine--tRNA ligase [Lachnospiraceae bacterium]|nr:valine--tRNA ligase [Lachnospiraceae bacterium]